MVYITLPVAYTLLYVTVVSFAAVVVVLQSCSNGRLVETVRESLFHPSEELLSSRGQHGWVSLMLSLVASFMGNWVLFLPLDAGAYYGWPGITGYAIASCLPYVVLLWFAPLVKRMTLTEGFAGTDYLVSRYGRTVQVGATLVSLCFMFVCLSMELTTVGITMRAVTGGAFPVFAAVIPIALVTLAYTTYGGLRASIMTDVYQGGLIVGLLVPLLVTVCLTGKKGVEELGGAATEAFSTPLSRQYIAGAVLIVSIWPTFLFDQGIWQRVWAGKSVRDVRIALGGAGALAFVCVFLSGAMGIVCREEALAYAQQQNEENVSVFAYLAQTLPAAWVGVLTVLAVTCVSSSVDTFQTALASVFAQDLIRKQLSFNWARVLIVCLNVPAILVAALQLDVLMLTMIANVMCVIGAGPLVASAWTKTNRVGMIGGFCLAFLAFLTCGWITTGDFVQGVAFIAPVDFSDVPYLVAFILVPLIGAVSTVGVSCLYTWFCARCLRPSKETSKVLSRHVEISDMLAASEQKMQSNVSSAVSLEKCVGDEQKVEDGGPTVFEIFPAADK
ncbi:transporter, solute:sodium symporter (SSS) family protein [Besnoitia besnoiti]|uniref:Transporter, solute:sodium symporter (SSS) family protein n=1 Tax=Besnoitia besnoiti TaxID=94643 RepID=A0A2A9M945_BESBE|nr:transporter, solute:sodium symporter (SSS) family protein [Besnoitia besnoiti]PFH32426.1 transporter, solute:sodium symporter (SSS) family protein [Besnoitia besnoiti]